MNLADPLFRVPFSLALDTARAVGCDLAQWLVDTNDTWFLTADERAAGKAAVDQVRRETIPPVPASPGHEQWAIWWLTEQDMRELAPDFEDMPMREAGARMKLPPRIVRLFRDRWGRPGRGRLWMPESAPVLQCCSPWPDSAEARHALVAGGLLIKRKDLVHVLGKPGVVTDFNLVRITSP